MEAYHLIVHYVSSRSDICSLSRVCKPFQIAAERALYNTLYLSGTDASVSLCELLINQRRLSAYVEALTITITDEEDKGSLLPSSETYWHSIAGALRAMTQLSHLGIYLENMALTGFGFGWILNDCQFRLLSFHCDLQWDSAVCSFLEQQVELKALYLMDFPPSFTISDEMDVSPPSSRTSEDRPLLFPVPESLPQLAILECPSVHAVEVLVPGRPITHIKTCFSTTGASEKRQELTKLFMQLNLSSKHIVSIDLGDISYSSEFTMEILRRCTSFRQTTEDLRYLGTVALPIIAQERLQFYSLLMKLPKLEFIEVEVSDWQPDPMSFAALRALTNELRMYCQSILRVSFVYKLDRLVVVLLDDGAGGCTIEEDENCDVIWREI